MGRPQGHTPGGGGQAGHGAGLGEGRQQLPQGNSQGGARGPHDNAVVRRGDARADARVQPVHQSEGPAAQLQAGPSGTGDDLHCVHLSRQALQRGGVARIPVGKRGGCQVEDRDLWRWKLPDSREVSAALDSYPKRFRVWDRLDVETLAREGTGILRYIRTQVENLAGMAQEQELAGYRVPVVNTSLLERHPEAEFAATYWDRDGRRHWSLRSRADGDFDVSQVALKLGGGGHPHAAGFTEEPGRWEPMNPAD